MALAPPAVCPLAQPLTAWVGTGAAIALSIVRFVVCARIGAGAAIPLRTVLRDRLLRWRRRRRGRRGGVDKSIERRRWSRVCCRVRWRPAQRG